eukprot:9647272-Lingulodinium_polyedra.AAC.1
MHTDAVHAAVADGRAGGGQQHARGRTAWGPAQDARAASARQHSCAAPEQAGVHGRSGEGQQRAAPR